MKNFWNYFTNKEKMLWFASLAFVSIFFFVFDKNNYLSYINSLIGITALLLTSKANPFSQILFIVFSIIYAYISFSYSYYGEMFNFIVLTIPISITTFIVWIKNSFKGNIAETKVRNTNLKEISIMIFLSVAVTIIFYFILNNFGTSNLVINTISVGTYFFAECLTIRRSPLFALGFAINDTIQISQWILATITNLSYISVVAYFIISLINDCYIFINWIHIQNKQANKE